MPLLLALCLPLPSCLYIPRRRAIIPASEDHADEEALAGLLNHPADGHGDQLFCAKVLAGVDHPSRPRRKRQSPRSETKNF